MITAVVVVYFLVGAAFNTIRSHQLGQQESQLQAEIGQLQGRYQRLQALKEYLASDEYVETVAREQLGLVRKGETGFIAISTVLSPTPAPGQPQPELWWDILIR
ncbi:MAG: septum formation initiator family protein [Dehalococcoidia bacterium]|nr:septum formation initiator family protein [Dehalococcoidia bacterium]